jgi:hypothetical protein
VHLCRFLSLSLSLAFFQAERDAEEAAEVAKIREAENEKPVESGGDAVLNWEASVQYDTA